MIEHFFLCPHCAQNISILIDNSIHTQNYIEDCEVCCNPIEINLRIEDGELIEFNVQNPQ